jgi:lipooligosaccharide transport system permease protein
MSTHLAEAAAPMGRGAGNSATAWTYRIRVWEYLLRQWRPYFVSGLAEAVGGPLLYLVALGLGMGSLVNARGTAVLGGVRYVDYIAPALLCAAALQIAFSECSFGTFGRIKWQRTLWGITATPVTPEIAADAHVLYISTRLSLSATLYYLVLLAFGAAGGPAGLLMIPIAVLTAMSVGVWILALSAVLEDDAPMAFNLVLRFGVIPASLFSASFFPISQLPWAVRWLAVCSPLWHGNELARDAALGGLPGWRVAMHLVVLVVLLVAGFAVARRRFRIRLAS